MKALQVYQAELEQAEGLGFRRAQPFAGRKHLASFKPSVNTHESVIAYEAALVRSMKTAHHRVELASENLGRAERRLETLECCRPSIKNEAAPWEKFQEWRLRRNWTSELEDQRNRIDLMRRRLESAEGDLEWVYDELVRARLWLDSFVLVAEEYFARRPLLRRVPEPEPPPTFVKVYEDIMSFIEEDPRREIKGRPLDIDGSDFGYDWRWIDFERPWMDSKWRVSYINKLREVYAVRCVPLSSEHFMWGERGEQLPRPVWLLRSNFGDKPSAGSWTFASREDEILSKLQRELMEYPNSLLALAERLQDDL